MLWALHSTGLIVTDCFLKPFIYFSLWQSNLHLRGGSRRGGGALRGQDPHPTPPRNVNKRGKTLRTCTQMQRILVVNSYLPPPPLSEILYPPLHLILIFIYTYSVNMKEKAKVQLISLSDHISEANSNLSGAPSDRCMQGTEQSPTTFCCHVTIQTQPIILLIQPF